MVTEVISESVPPLPIDVDGVLIAVESVTWVEDVIEIDGQLEEVP